MLVISHELNEECGHHVLSAVFI